MIQEWVVRHQAGSKFKTSNMIELLLYVLSALYFKVMYYNYVISKLWYIFLECIGWCYTRQCFSICRASKYAWQSLYPGSQTCMVTKLDMEIVTLSFVNTTISVLWNFKAGLCFQGWFVPSLWVPWAVFCAWQPLHEGKLLYII